MKQRFIAGAVCPKCHEQDSLAVTVDDSGHSEVICVVCGYREQQPVESKKKVGEPIALFKP
ncbi:MAG: hypothetical protein CENE_00836 [Candidatus Celerinatantimonas neptuna]|nr:MAG: hypothetical protein CENE_00836 [Candidatus Celerinatantimonas neptuna]